MAGDPPHAEVLLQDHLGAEDRVRRETIMQIMCNLGVDYAAMSQRFSIDFTAHFAKELASLDDLEADGYITKIRGGRRLRYRINPNLYLRDEMLQDKAVGDFLEVLGWRRRRRLAEERELVALGEKAGS
jgi:coproporphyrinogen III oxidase-like Fe-S oxidoreductase